MKKYEFTGEVKVKFGVTLKRIRAIIDFGNVNSLKKKRICHTETTQRSTATQGSPATQTIC